MDKIGEIINRWHRVLEKPTVDLQKEALAKITKEQNINDFRYLLDNIKGLESRLSAAQNPYSSQVGAVVLWKDGEMYYMINGSYLSVQNIAQGLQLLVKLANKEKKLSKDSQEVVEPIQKVVNCEDIKETPQKDESSTNLFLWM